MKNKELLAGIKFFDDEGNEVSFEQVVSAKRLYHIAETVSGVEFTVFTVGPDLLEDTEKDGIDDNMRKLNKRKRANVDSLLHEHGLSTSTTDW